MPYLVKHPLKMGSPGNSSLKNHRRLAPYLAIRSNDRILIEDPNNYKNLVIESNKVVIHQVTKSKESPKDRKDASFHRPPPRSNKKKLDHLFKIDIKAQQNQS